jgi:hypothetical protein
MTGQHCNAQGTCNSVARIWKKRKSRHHVIKMALKKNCHAIFQSNSMVKPLIMSLMHAAIALMSAGVAKVRPSHCVMWSIHVRSVLSLIYGSWKHTLQFCRLVYDWPCRLTVFWLTLLQGSWRGPVSCKRSSKRFKCTLKPLGWRYLIIYLAYGYQRATYITDRIHTI